MHTLPFLVFRQSPILGVSGHEVSALVDVLPHVLDKIRLVAGVMVQGVETQFDVRGDALPQERGLHAEAVLGGKALVGVRDELEALRHLRIHQIQRHPPFQFPPPCVQHERIAHKIISAEDPAFLGQVNKIPVLRIAQHVGRNQDVRADDLRLRVFGFHQAGKLLDGNRPGTTEPNFIDDRPLLGAKQAANAGVTQQIAVLAI